MSISIQSKRLPPGQQVRADFPRFGMPHYAGYTPSVVEDHSIELVGDLGEQKLTQQDLNKLNRVDLTADFHCVTSWTHCDIQWSGFRFRDVYEQFIVPQLVEDDDLTIATFTGLDRYRATMFLEDALTDDVLLVDLMNNQPLSGEHGAPIRLVAPAHYGYKSVKHLSKIGVWRTTQADNRGIRKMMEHPRGRVAFEERGRYFPGWLLRLVYRPLIERTIRQFEHTTQELSNETI